MSWVSCIASNIFLASVVAMAAWFAQRHLRMMAAARILWLLALVKLLTPPLVSLPLGSLACALGTCNCGHALTQSFVRDTLPWVLLAAWLAGAVLMFWIACRRWIRFRRLLAHATAAPEEWQRLAVRHCSELSIRRPPEILTVPGNLPPMVIPGWPRARLLLPQGLLSQLNRSQRSALLLHELSHIRRGDHLVRLLELAVSVAFWWLPIFGLIGRQLRACEESACDAAVVAHLPQARREYARLILDVVDFAHPLSPQAVPQATAMSAADGLEQRLHAILDAPRGSRDKWPAAALAIGVACAILPCELHCELVAPTKTTLRALDTSPSASVWTDGCEPAASATPSAPIEVERQLRALCCPS
jgi:beta-lactamase regulating signal transducer with metallopeptidase domain